MGSSNSRTIQVKFTGDVSDLVVKVGEANTALDTMGKNSSKNSNALSDFSKAMDKVSSSMDGVIRNGAKLIVFEQAITWINQLRAVIVPMAGTLGLIPGILGVVAAGFVTAKLGADGITAAFKGSTTPASQALSKEFKTNLTPAAKQLTGLLKDLTPALKGVADSESDFISALIRTASAKTNVTALNTVIGSTGLVVDNLRDSIAPLEGALIQAAAVAAPIFAGLTNSIVGWAQVLADKITTASQDGRLAAWINNGIQGVKTFADDVKRVFDTIAPIVKAFAGIRITLFSDIAPALVTVLTAVGNFLSANPSLATWIVGTALALKGLAVAVGLVDAAMDLNPVVLIIAAIAALVVGFVILWNKSAAFRQFWINAWNDIQAIVKAVVAWWQANIAPIISKVVADVEGIVNRLKQLWTAFWASDFGQLVKANLDLVWGIIKGAFTVLVGILQGAWDIIKGVFQGAWDIIKGVFQGAVSIIEGILDIFIGIFTGNWSKAWDGVKEVFSGVWDIIKGIGQGLGAFFGGIGSAIGDVCTGIGHAFEGVWTSVSDWFGRIIDFVSRIPGQIIGFFSDIGSKIGEGLKAGLNGVITFLDKAISGLNNVTGVVGIPAIPQIPHLAKGGPLNAGQMALVGENGPELFVPNGSGQVIPNGQTASMLGGGDLHITLDLGAGITQRIKISNRQLKAAALAKGGKP